MRVVFVFFGWSIVLEVYLLMVIISEFIFRFRES